MDMSTDSGQRQRYATLSQLLMRGSMIELNDVWLIPEKRFKQRLVIWSVAYNTRTVETTVCSDEKQ